jgi:hypothetical protein
MQLNPDFQSHDKYVALNADAALGTSTVGEVLEAGRDMHPR